MPLVEQNMLTLVQHLNATPVCRLLCLAKLTRIFILGILIAWSRKYFSIILIIVNCCIRFICDIVGTVCSLEWFNSAETRSLFSNNFRSGRWWYRSQNCWNSSWDIWFQYNVLSHANRNVTIFLRSSVMYRYLFSVLTELADHLPVFLLKLLWYLLLNNKAIC